MRPPRIFVVDDESTIRHVLMRVLQSHDCEAREAASAEEAMGQLQGWQPDVVLLDIVLPGKNGLELLSEIKHLSQDIEVLMMTSNSRREDILRVLVTGADDFILKPFEPLDLKIRLRVGTRILNMEQQLRATSYLAPPSL